MPTAQTTTRDIVDAQRIQEALERPAPDASRVREILAHAVELKGLTLDEAADLSLVDDLELSAEIEAAASTVKDTIYGRRLVLFAPLYISNFCSNDCLYCAFRCGNRDVRRRALSQEEIAEETRALVSQGHKRVLLVAGEQSGSSYLDFVIESIRTVYATREGRGEVRRINVNVAPLDVEGFRRLAAEGIGTYQCFQETYDPVAYARYHVRGPKADYAWRLSAMDRAMMGGIDDVGIGPLLGLADWRFDLLATLSHAEYLDRTYGVGPHTISIPRLEPADGSPIAADPPAPVSDADFRRVIAILRLAVPYTGIILSTRETPAMRRAALALGVSQISAGSRTDPGGYSQPDTAVGQFSLGDHRSLDEVIRDIAALGYIPSFCTGCYRLGRTGADFMDLAKPGAIRAHCGPNAVSTFAEYLEDYASEETREVGLRALETILDTMAPPHRATAMRLLERIRAGERDAFC